MLSALAGLKLIRIAELIEKIMEFFLLHLSDDRITITNPLHLQQQLLLGCTIYRKRVSNEQRN